MKRITRSLLAVAVAGAVSFSPVAGAASQPFVTTVYAHGGHCGGGGYHCGQGYGNGYGYGNCNGGGSGVCYYYCDGHAAHLHANGVCPYAAKPAPEKQTTSKSTIKKVQRRLNRLGYKCGKVNGVMNAKTKKAVKRFKISRGLKANSAIGKPVLRALGL